MFRSGVCTLSASGMFSASAVFSEPKCVGSVESVKGVAR